MRVRVYSCFTHRLWKWSESLSRVTAHRRLQIMQFDGGMASSFFYLLLPPHNLIITEMRGFFSFGARFTRYKIAPSYQGANGLEQKIQVTKERTCYQNILNILWSIFSSSLLQCCCAFCREWPRELLRWHRSYKKRILSRHLALMMMPSLGRFFFFFFFLFVLSHWDSAWLYSSKQQSSSTCWLFDRPHLLLLGLALLGSVPICM